MNLLIHNYTFMFLFVDQIHKLVVTVAVVVSNCQATQLVKEKFVGSSTNRGFSRKVS